MGLGHQVCEQRRRQERSHRGLEDVRSRFGAREEGRSEEKAGWIRWRWGFACSVLLCFPGSLRYYGFSQPHFSRDFSPLFFTKLTLLMFVFAWIPSATYPFLNVRGAAVNSHSLFWGKRILLAVSLVDLDQNMTDTQMQATEFSLSISSLWPPVALQGFSDSEQSRHHNFSRLQITCCK